MGKKKAEAQEDVLRNYYNEGVREGMSKCHDVHYNALSRLKQSLDDVMCLYMEEDGDTQSERIAKLQIAYDALTFFADRFQDDYFDKYDSLKETETIDWEDLRNELEL